MAILTIRCSENLRGRLLAVAALDGGRSGNSFAVAALEAAVSAAEAKMSGATMPVTITDLSQNQKDVNASTSKGSTE